MPIVQSYNKIYENYGRSKSENVKNNKSKLSKLIFSIATEILIKDPLMVANVATGKVSKSTLESAILHAIENNIENYGIYHDKLLKQVLDFMYGYGPLQELIENDDITDIDGTKFNEFSIKIKGERFETSVEFFDENEFDTFCRLVIIRNGGIINENDSHCRVVDEKNRLRINVSIPPRNLNGASICIRKHKKDSYSMDDLEDLKMLNQVNKQLLKDIAKGEGSVLFCGKGGSGKTTLLRAFIGEMPKMERILVVESDSEIYPQKPNCICQRIKKNNEGGNILTLKELVSDGLTMSLDTYCVGEIVGDEAWEYLRASFSGHRTLATTHCESAIDALNRLLILARPGCKGESDSLIKSIIATGVDFIVYLKKFQVKEIIGVRGYNDEKNEYNIQNIWE